jgi:hypothetical protein
MSLIYPLNYFKSNVIDLHDYPYPYPKFTEKPKCLADSVCNIQLYVPIYNRLFELNETNYNTISLNHFYHIGKNMPLTADKVFIKYSPLLDPIKYMVGKYDLSDSKIKTLPSWSSNDTTCDLKMLNTSNASYVDGFFYYLSSVLKNHHGFVHGIDFYGTYLCIQDKFKINVEDELDYLSSSPFFLDNIGKLMMLENFDENMYNSNMSNDSRRSKQQLVIQDDEIDTTIDLGICDISDLQSKSTVINPLLVTDSSCDLVYCKSEFEETNSESSSNNDTDDDDNDDDENETDDDDDNETDDDENNKEGDDDDNKQKGDDEDVDMEKEVIAYINNFPVQMIFLEKCDGTLDSLFEAKFPDIEAKSALFQIIIILLVYQHMFQFTHNDLHTNNIMYVKTNQEFLYYKYKDLTYKVPTYGRIFKIIDYGRSIFKYQKQIFCSDSFAPGGDADTQYNCEPFFCNNKPRLEPNMSFDLCRLGCSIFDFLFDDVKYNADSDLKRIIQNWCKDDDNRNILYKKNGSERFPGFKLYKMIARTVHKHTPESQLQDSWFQEYVSHDFIPPETPIMEIDKYPDYT